MGDLALTGRRALVSGGSRGIGRAIVRALAGQGCAVIGTYVRDTAAVRALADELEARRDGSALVQADASDAAQIEALAETVRQRLGGLDLLVNNAGVVSHKTLDELSIEEWHRVLDTNLTGMFLLTRAVSGLLSEGASIVNLTSGAAMVGIAGRIHYTASKAGVIGFTRSLAREMGPRGIRVNAIAPGIIDTDQASHLTPELRERYSRMAALGRLGEAEDVARVVLFLASDLSGFVSGAVVAVDGGI